MKNYAKPFLDISQDDVEYENLGLILQEIGHPKQFIQPFGWDLTAYLNLKPEFAIINDEDENLINLYGDIQVDCKNYLDFVGRFVKDKFMRANGSEGFVKTRFARERNPEMKNCWFLWKELCAPFGLSSYASWNARKRIMNFHRKANSVTTLFTSTKFENLFLAYINGDELFYDDAPVFFCSPLGRVRTLTPDGYMLANLVSLAKMAAKNGAKVIILDDDYGNSDQKYKQATNIIRLDWDVNYNSPPKILAIYKK